MRGQTIFVSSQANLRLITEIHYLPSASQHACKFVAFFCFLSEGVRPAAYFAPVRNHSSAEFPPFRNQVIFIVTFWNFFGYFISRTSCTILYTLLWWLGLTVLPEDTTENFTPIMFNRCYHAGKFSKDLSFKSSKWKIRKVWLKKILLLIDSARNEYNCFFVFFAPLRCC